MKVLIKLFLVLLFISSCVNEKGPEIEIWYGERQKVGNAGKIQNDFNLLGNISMQNGIEELNYTLNDSEPVSLNYGIHPLFGDQRRLARHGDFNADIRLEDLNPGENKIKIYARDTLGNENTRVIMVDKQSGNSSLPLYVNWQKADHLQDVCQIIDGKWKKTKFGIRPEISGYDRVVALGNNDWQDYEVKFKVVVHGFDSLVCENCGVEGRSFGPLLRFKGHSSGVFKNWQVKWWGMDSAIYIDHEFPETQPKWGYQPIGGIGFLTFSQSIYEKTGETFLLHEYFYGGKSRNEIKDTISFAFGDTFWMKMRCRSQGFSAPDSAITKYSLAVWKDGETEPSGWDYSVTDTCQHALQRGSLALIAHCADVEFGNVEIREIK